MYHGNYTIVVPWSYQGNHGCSIEGDSRCDSGNFTMVVPWSYRGNHGCTIIGDARCDRGNFTIYNNGKITSGTMVLPWLYHGPTMVILP